MSTRSQSTGDQRFFSTTKRGEISEWREQLNSEKEYTRKEAVKRVIAAMTVGKDVSMLFSDVIKSIQTGNIELKKLVYLYVMNYAKSKPDLAIMAVNTFVKDSTHSNPLVRALAVRTMGCIRVDRIVEYLSEPLRRTLKDKDPYVRKTAAVAVAKLFDLNPQLTIDQGFIEALEELLTDQTPMVVANAVAALSEIAANSNEVVLDFTEKTVNTLLAALNECTEYVLLLVNSCLYFYKDGDKSLF
jgi:AP-1 complex subunit beta-1